jgi:hypothetical protein
MDGHVDSLRFEVTAIGDEKPRKPQRRLVEVKRVLPPRSQREDLRAKYGAGPGTNSDRMRGPRK